MGIADSGRWKLRAQMPGFYSSMERGLESSDTWILLPHKVRNWKPGHLGPILRSTTGSQMPGSYSQF